MIVKSGRSVTALVTYGDDYLGAIGPFDVDSPWWADVEPVVTRLREVLGVNVVILRLVQVTGGAAPRDGHVTYHAEALERPSRPITHSPSPATLAEDAPKRATWATADGVRAALAWTDDALRQLDRPATVSTTDQVEQVKTWNLSGLFRIPTPAGPVWLKLTPPFAAHEPAVIARIAAVDPSIVPIVHATDPANRRVLFEQIPGEDCWDAPAELLAAMAARWVRAQAEIAAQTVIKDQTATEVQSVAGIPDRRLERLGGDVRRLLDGDAGTQLEPSERADAEALVARLPEIVERLVACGLPYTLVHGDFHPGNVRSDGVGTVLFDFADAYIGHPALDGVRMRDYLDPARRGPVVAAWCAAWAEHAPGSDPARALELATPLNHLAGSVLYQMFLDHIETSERPYHEGDPVAGIRAAIEAARDLR